MHDYVNPWMENIFYNHLCTNTCYALYHTDNNRKEHFTKAALSADVLVFEIISLKYNSQIILVHGIGNR